MEEAHCGVRADPGKVYFCLGLNYAGITIHRTLGELYRERAEGVN